MVREARNKGLTVPVLLMGESCRRQYRAPPQDIYTLSSGYYNPMLAYGEDKAIHDAVEAGANGYIVVDLPPEEAITFRDKCRAAK